MPNRRSGCLISLLLNILTLPFRILKSLFDRTRHRRYARSKKGGYPYIVPEPIWTPPTPQTSETPFQPKYERKFLLTKNEWFFYKELKPIADKLNLTVLAKIRMADLVEPVADTNSDFFKSFAKVKAKHVDFALCQPDNLFVMLLIELDDNSHKEGNERDFFVESVYQAVGYKLLRVRNAYNLELQIKQALNIQD